MPKIVSVQAIKARISELEKELEMKLGAGKRVARLRKFIAANGIVKSDFNAAFHGPKANGKLPPKYWHPTDPALTWSGKARPPKWLAALEKKGTKRDTLTKKPATYPKQDK